MLVLPKKFTLRWQARFAIHQGSRKKDSKAVSEHLFNSWKLLMVTLPLLQWDRDFRLGIARPGHGNKASSAVKVHGNADSQLSRQHRQDSWSFQHHKF